MFTLEKLCFSFEGNADGLLIMAADIEYLQYKFHIKDTYNTVDEETLTGLCASTYTWVVLLLTLATLKYFYINYGTQSVFFSI